MKVYEIINPHDPYTIESDDEALLAAAILVLGEGHYAARGVEDPGETVPMFIAGGALEWFELKFNVTLPSFLDERMQDIAAVLGTVVAGDDDARLIFLYEQGKLQTEAAKLEHRQMWECVMVTSTVNLMAKAWEYVERAKYFANNGSGQGA